MVFDWLCIWPRRVQASNTGRLEPEEAPGRPSQPAACLLQWCCPAPPSLHQYHCSESIHTAPSTVLHPKTMLSPPCAMTDKLNTELPLTASLLLQWCCRAPPSWRALLAAPPQPRWSCR